MLPNRPLEIAGFLEQHGWGDAAAAAFDGDFSPRRYARLTKADGTVAILMDADSDQKTPHFIHIAKILRRCGITVPEIYASMPEQGLVLLQDFGTRNVGALLDSGVDAKPYFLRATEILAHLHRGFDRGDALGLDLSPLNTDYFIPQVELFLDAYVPYAKNREATETERGDFCAAWRAVLRPIETMPKSLMLRDFMPDNLMELADGSLGVLDFQEAGVGCVAYDLSSLCEEVRRDGAFALLPDVITHYIGAAQSPLSHADLMRACIILSAQRHTRMLGNVARTAVKRGQQGRLLPYLPRIEKHLHSILAQPYLMPVREWMMEFMQS